MVALGMIVSDWPQYWLDVGYSVEGDNDVVHFEKKSEPEKLSPLLQQVPILRNKFDSTLFFTFIIV